MKNLGKNKSDLEQIKKLHFQGNTDVSIARIMQRSKSAIRYYRKYLLNLPTVREDITLTKDQEEILLGTLLGDSSIRYIHDKCKYPSLSFSHCKKQELYANIKFDKFRIIMSSIKERCYKTETVIQGKRCKAQPVIYAVGRNCKCLVKYRELFYNAEGKKIIPIEYLKEHFTAQSLAYLYMDDGCKNQKSYNLNMQCFTKKELLNFALFLELRFDLEFIVKSDKTLYLRYNSIKKFESLICSYITEDMKYKIHESHR